MRTYERHQLKQDRFAETTKETISWAVEHRSKLILGSAIVAIILIAIIGGAWLWGYRNQQANMALGAAMNTYSAPILPPGTPKEGDMVTFTSAQERARVAHNEFQKIADSYELTKAGQVARYMAAVTLNDMGDTKGAEAELKNVADSRNRDLASLAKLALAGMYRDSNRNTDAMQLYKDLIANPTSSVSKATAQLELASLYENTNQASEAGKLYSEIMKDDPRSAAAGIANQHLSSMK